MRKITRKSLSGINIKNVVLYPNGKRTKDKVVGDLKTIGIQLRGKQITDFVSSIMNMVKQGHTEINITGFLKKKSISFTSQIVTKNICSDAETCDTR